MFGGGGGGGGSEGRPHLPLAKHESLLQHGDAELHNMPAVPHAGAGGGGDTHALLEQIRLGQQSAVVAQAS